MNTVGKKIVSGILGACIALPFGAALLTKSVKVNAGEIGTEYDTYESLSTFEDDDIIFNGTEFNFNMMRYSSFTLIVDGEVVAEGTNGSNINYTFNSDVRIINSNNAGTPMTAGVMRCETVEYRVCDPLSFTSDVGPAPSAPSASSAPSRASVIEVVPARLLTIRHFVESLYVDALGRNGTIEERNQWVNMINGQGVTGDMMVEAFLGSKEFANRNLNNEEFVVVINNIFFGGAMSAVAQAKVLDDLNTGISRADIVEQMINTESWASVCAHNLVVHEDKVS